MVDEKVRANVRAGMEVDSGPAVRPLGHDAWDERHATSVKLISHPLHCNRLDKRIGHHNLLMAECGGVAGVSGLNVGLEHFTDRGEAAEKLSRNLAGQWPWFNSTFVRGPVLEALRNLVLESTAYAVHQSRNIDLQLGGLNRFLIKKTGQQQP